MMAKKLNRRQARWSLYLARFDFLLHHCPGHTMGKPDALLRRANHGNGALDNENIVLLQLEFLVVRALEGVERTGIEQKILSDIHKGNRNGDQEEPIAKAARDSTFLGVVEHRWPTPVLREDIRTTESRLMQTDHSPLP